MERVLSAHPELRDALAFALAKVAREQPDDPMVATGLALREYNQTVLGRAPRMLARATSFVEPVAAPDRVVADDDDDARRRAAAAGGRRRGSVFAEPVQADASFRPRVISKTEAERDEIRAAVSGNILFSGLDPDQREMLIGAMERCSFVRGATVLGEGDASEQYMVIASGSADVLVGGRCVLSLGPGQAFGELALMYDSPRSATIIATKDLVSWAIDRQTFKQVVVATTMRKRELYAEFLAQVPILQTLTDAERLALVDAIHPLRVARGTVVVTEGELGADRFFMVESGELFGTKRGVAGECCPRLGPGDYFGERALLRSEPRAATIVAAEDSTLLCLDRATFVRLLGPVSVLLSRNMSVYAEYDDVAVATSSSSSGSGAGGGRFPRSLPSVGSMAQLMRTRSHIEMDESRHVIGERVNEDDEDQEEDEDGIQSVHERDL